MVVGPCSSTRRRCLEAHNVTRLEMHRDAVWWLEVLSAARQLCDAP
jgi:hypothetical protein